MTVQDLLDEAVRHRPGIVYEHESEGKLAYLKSINGVGNQGVVGRNWQFSVNGKLGNESFAVEKVAPGDRVLWFFEPAG